MGEDARELDAGERIPAFARRGLRLGLLLAVLAAVAAYGIPRIIHDVGGPGLGSCSPGHVPATLKWSPSRLALTVRRLGLGSLVGDGRLDVQGLQEPVAAWVDSPPPEFTGRLPATADAGYEMVWWSAADDHRAASVFVFPSRRAAVQYVREAGSTRCRRSAAAYRLTQPAGARGVVWTNPVQARQADVFFSRGARVYRVLDVPPSANGGDAPIDGRELMAEAQQLACLVREAGCGATPPPRPPARPAAPR